MALNEHALFQKMLLTPKTKLKPFEVPEHKHDFFISCIRHSKGMIDVWRTATVCIALQGACKEATSSDVASQWH